MNLQINNSIDIKILNFLETSSRRNTYTNTNDVITDIHNELRITTDGSVASVDMRKDIPEEITSLKIINDEGNVIAEYKQYDILESIDRQVKGSGLCTVLLFRIKAESEAATIAR